VTIRVLIADDHAIVRQGLCRVLALTADIEVGGEVSDGWQLLDHLKQHQGVDLVLLEMSIPGPAGIDLIIMLKDLWPDMPVLVFSTYGDSEFVGNTIRAGARGYITKDSDPETIISAIRYCAAGRYYLHPSLGAKFILDELRPPKPGPHLKLSTRELQVFPLLAMGLGVTVIGEKLHISPKTVSTHKYRILQKLSMTSVSEIVRYAVKHQLIES
jgi:two-component system, NarL family, invasion response regulator UvrY